MLATRQPYLGNVEMAKIIKLSDFLGLAAEKLQSTPRLRRAAARAYVLLRKYLLAVGIGIPRQTPAGLRKLRGIYSRGKPAASNEDAGPRVLILSPRGWATHLLVDTLLAESLQCRGASAVIWTCGLEMPVCHITNTNEAPPMPCAGCKQSQDDLLDSSGLSRIRSSEFINNQTFERLKSSISRLSQDEILSQVTSGINLGETVRDAITWFRLTADIPKSEQTLKLLRDFLLLAETSLHVSRAILDEVKPDLVIMLNGVFTEESILRNLCQQTGTPYITYERAYGFNQFIFCRNQIANHYDLSGHWDHLREIPLSDDEDRNLDEVLINWRQGHGAVVRYWETPDERDSEIMQSLGLPRDKKIVTLFTNVVWDTAMFGLDVLFSDMWDWVSSTIKMVEEDPGVHLIIRVHPAEVKLKGSESRDRVADRIKREFEHLPENISIIAPENTISSYNLLALSNTILVYTSTIGLEAAIEGRNVIMCGDTHYRGKGFTFDPVDRDQYKAALLRDPGSSDDAEKISTLARRYAHLFFLRHMYPLPIIEEHMMGNPGLTIDSLDELSVGHNKELDYLCEFILGSAAKLEPEALITKAVPC
jgi:Capsule polysaccharide biosynthesis protein